MRLGEVTSRQQMIKVTNLTETNVSNELQDYIFFIQVKGKDLIGTI